jgi:probable HAF family extracellular repeat protein
MTNTLNQIVRRSTVAKTAALRVSLIAVTLILPFVTRAEPPKAKKQSRYKLIDLGTFGGPASRFEFLTQIVNNSGTVVGGADTPNPDPFDPNCFSRSCFVRHAFQWQNGALTDLGALPGGGSSMALWLNQRGQAVGLSQNGLIDSLTGTPAFVAVLWQNGEIINLGTFGGEQSYAIGINNRGQIAGGAANTIPDPFSLVGFGTQTRAFLWEKGVKRDLGTLGGPSSFVWAMNERGQVAGESYTDSTPNDTTGIPTLHPFLWEDGRMLDLGSLGGTFCEVAALNNRGDVVGNMNLPGDEFSHPFLWRQGTLLDLGTLGGNNGAARWVNDVGDVVGTADLADGSRNAFLWKNGVMTDLGNLGKTSSAHSVNSMGQVVGASRVSFVTGEIRAFLWEKGGPMVDLNSLVPADSPLHLVYANSINERGEIAGTGLPRGVPFEQDVEALTDKRGRAFVLIPINEDAPESSVTP